MARKEFTYPVGGSGGQPIDVSSVDSIETDEYSDGGAETFSDGDYPATISPDMIIEELLVFAIPDDKTLDLTTDAGNTISGMEPRGQKFALDTLEIAEVVINDPEGTGGDTSIAYVGES